jgi:alanyl-tRNA synthetase
MPPWSKQKAAGRAAGKFKMDKALEYTGDGQQFVRLRQLTEASKVVALYADGTPVQRLNAGQSGVVVLDSTPFYAESGGQVGDQGASSATRRCLCVADTQKIKSDVFGHHGVLKTGTLKWATVTAACQRQLRAATMRNHSRHAPDAQGAARSAGQPCAAKGQPGQRRAHAFDFTHNAPVTDAQIHEIEAR